MRAKHWLYEVTVGRPATIRLPPMPAVGWQEVFGAQTGGSGATAFDMRCDRKTPGTDDSQRGALRDRLLHDQQGRAGRPTRPDQWTLEQAQAPAEGRRQRHGDHEVLLVSPARPAASPTTASSYGASVARSAMPRRTRFAMTVSIESCASNKVNADEVTTASVAWANDGHNAPSTYTKVGPFLFWEGAIAQGKNSTDHTRESNFGGQVDGLDKDTSSSRGTATLRTSTPTKTCRGWEPNGTYEGQVGPITEVDPYPDASGYDLRRADDLGNLRPARHDLRLALHLRRHHSARLEPGQQAGGPRPAESAAAATARPITSRTATRGRELPAAGERQPQAAARHRLLAARRLVLDVPPVVLGVRRSRQLRRHRLGGHRRPERPELELPQEVRADDHRRRRVVRRQHRRSRPRTTTRTTSASSRTASRRPPTSAATAPRSSRRRTSRRW